MKLCKWKKIIANLRSPHLDVEAATFNYICNISLKHNYMYVETPKVACSTIKNTLINAELEQIVEYSDFEQLHIRHNSPLIDPPKVGDFEIFMKKCQFKFCFVRNPYTRILSSYLDKISPVGAWRRAQVLRYHEIEEPADLTFEQFLDFVCHQDYPDMDIHWRLQSDLLCVDNIEYDFFGKFESFENDFMFVLDKIGIDASKFYIQEIRHATSADNQVDAYYNDNLKRKVYAKFLFDFDKFGYNR